MINSFAFVLLFLLLIGILEWYLRVKNGDKQYPMGSLMMNISIGAMDQMGSLVYFSLLYFTLSYVYTNFRIFEIPNSWYIWVLAYVAIDFLGYWYHRWSHRINILWAGHVTHHSSERFNFSNGFRTSPFQGINRIIFWTTLPLVGFPPDVLVITLKFSGIYDFIVHTEYVPKLRLIEKIFITPSLHRVHHGKNDLYIDKNYGSTFSIWDRLFGTYQEETEKVVYGIKGSYLDNNPFWAIGHHYYYLWKTMKETPRWSDKLKFIFMPPEWRPTGVKEIETTHQNDKTPATNNLRYYAIFQISICTIGVIFLLAYRAFMPNWEFSLCAILCVINLSRSTMIFNDNISNRFEKQELIWLAFQAIVILTLMLTYSNFSLVYFVVSLLISLLLIGRINKVAYN